MTTATPTRTMRDVLLERMEADRSGNPPHASVEFDDGIGAMVYAATRPWRHEDEDELRASELRWIQEVEHEADEAAREAAIDAAVAVLEAGLRRLANPDDPTVPAHLLEQGPDELRDDVALVTSA